MEKLENRIPLKKWYLRFIFGSLNKEAGNCGDCFFSQDHIELIQFTRGFIFAICVHFRWTIGDQKGTEGAGRALEPRMGYISSTFFTGNYTILYLFFEKNLGSCSKICS